MQLASVPFYQDNLVLINQDNEPFVAMKPIVVQMGLDWKGQHAKITEKFNSTMEIISTVGEDGKLRNMICLPLRKLPAWLYSISPNKVAPEIKDKVIQYQEECDDVLWQYWTTGFAGNMTSRMNVSLANHRLKLLDLLEKETHPVKREAIYEQLQAASNELGLSTPTLDSLGSNNIYDELLGQFWDFYKNNKSKLNHSKDTDFIAIDGVDVYRSFVKDSKRKLSSTELILALKSSDSPKYLENKEIESGIKDSELMYCYIFENSFTE